jgi:hypothetical protein
MESSMRRLICFLAAAVFSVVVAGTADAQSSGFTGTQKYREKNPAGGKGRSGGATLVARMLADKAGNTVLEATTGDFENSTAPTGEFTKIHVSAIDANGVAMYSFKYDLSGGSYFKQTYQGIFAGQAFTVHGHIRTATKKNGNVIVTTTVQKRPDLHAERIVTPSRVPVAIPVPITGVITELNGQIGARSDCVLYANDVEVDRTIGIWVDSGDSVSCAFSPTFAAVGAVNLRLAAESVAPGDWDTANNSLERMIEVSSLDPNFDVATVEAAVVDVGNTTFAQVGRFVNSTTPATGYDWVYEDKVDRNSDVFVYGAVALGITDAPFALQASATDGTATWLLQRAVPGCFDYSVGRVDGRSFYTYVTGCGNLYVEVGSYAGVVTYASRMLARTFQVVAGQIAYDGPAQFIFNNVSTEVEDGDNLFRGGSWTIDVAVAAGPFVFNAPVTVQLNQPFDNGETTPSTCTSTPTSFTCSQSSWRIAGRSGETTVVRDIPTP